MHPSASILAEAGPIILGKNNIIEELVVLKNCDGKELRLGDNNVLEVGCEVAASMESNNVIESQAKIAPGAVLSSGHVICARYHHPPVPSGKGSVCWEHGSGTLSSVALQNHLSTHADHLGILWKALPNFHHLRRSS